MPSFVNRGFPSLSKSMIPFQSEGFAIAPLARAILMPIFSLRTLGSPALNSSGVGDSSGMPESRRAFSRLNILPSLSLFTPIFPSFVISIMPAQSSGLMTASLAMLILDPSDAGSSPLSSSIPEFARTAATANIGASLSLFTVTLPFLSISIMLFQLSGFRITSVPMAILRPSIFGCLPVSLSMPISLRASSTANIFVRASLFTSIPPSL